MLLNLGKATFSPSEDTLSFKISSDDNEVKNFVEKDVTNVLSSIIKDLISNISKEKDPKILAGTKILFDKKIDFAFDPEGISEEKKGLVKIENAIIETIDIDPNFTNIGEIKNSLVSKNPSIKEFAVEELTKAIAINLYVSAKETDDLGYKLKTPLIDDGDNFITVEIKTDKILLDLLSSYETVESIVYDLSNEIETILAGNVSDLKKAIGIEFDIKFKKGINNKIEVLKQKTRYTVKEISGWINHKQQSENIEELNEELNSNDMSEKYNAVTYVKGQVENALTEE